MLTEQQKTAILQAALTAFRLQRGITFNVADFDLIIDKPAQNSFCSFYVVSKRTDDHLRLKLYVNNFSKFTNVESFRLIQEQNYSSGANDEVQLANMTLDVTEFRSFQQYLLSDQFRQDVITATDRIQLEDGTGFVLTESTAQVNLEH